MSLQREFQHRVISAGNTSSTFRAYWPHVVSFIRYTRQQRGPEISRDEVTIEDVFRWRDHLANHLHLSPKSCNQAISAVKFLFCHVIEKPLPETDSRPLRLREPRRQRRQMISRQQIKRLFSAMTPADRVLAQIMYAAVLRLDDALNLRIKDLNFDSQQIQIASTKHNHFRFVPFPRSIHDAAQLQIGQMKSLYDRGGNPNGVPVGFAYARKNPTAPHDFRWFWLFASYQLSTDPTDGKQKRYHRDADNFRRRFREAVRRAGITRRITPHDLRRSAATHLHLAGMPLTRLRDILGHNDVKTTELYIFQDDVDISGKDSPFDLLEE